MKKDGSHPFESRRFFLFFLLIVIFCFADYSSAQDSLNTILLDAMEYYYSGNYTKTIKILQKALKDYKDGDRLSAHKFIAFSYVAMGDVYAARKHFKKILEISPDFKLDSAAVSPHAYSSFLSAKKERRSESAMCSCFLPGSGQIMIGEDRKGKIIMFTTTVLAGTSILSWLITENKHNNYRELGPDERARMDELYNDYNKWFKISIASTVLFFTSYLYGILDLLPVFSRRPQKVSIRFEYEKKSIQLVYKMELGN